MLFMLIGRFRRSSDATRASRLRAGMAPPAGLRYFGSWVDASLRRCFQVVDCDDAAALQRWAARWRHCVELEVVPIVPATDAIGALQPLLD